MFDRFSRSWELVKASWAILGEDKALLVFPLLSALAMLAVVAAFALPVVGIAGWDGLSQLDRRHLSVGHYALAFAFYVVQYFVAFYFNAALVGAAMQRMDGHPAGVSDGLDIASSRLWSIFGYALIAATVGVILRAIQERVGFIGKIVVGLLGAGWSIATYLVVPTLVAREVGPAEAIQESASLLKRTWGENVIGQSGLSMAFGLFYFLVALAGVGLILLAAMANSGALVAFAVAAIVVGIVVTMLIHSALAGIYAAALYRYATSEKGGTGSFNRDALQLAFKPK